MRKAIDLSVSIGLRTIQLAGYDVYYEPSDQETRQRFIEGLRWAVDEAAGSQVMLAVEIMDTPFINSISAWLEYDKIIDPLSSACIPTSAICRHGTTMCRRS